MPHPTFRACAFVVGIMMLACSKQPAVAFFSKASKPAPDASSVSNSTPPGSANNVGANGVVADSSGEVKPATMQEYTVYRAEASSTTSGWPVSNVYDQDPGSSWSSVARTQALGVEWLAFWWNEGIRPVNFVKLRPRFTTLAGASVALGFPVEFKVKISNGSSWIDVASYSNFPIPRNNDWIVLPLPTVYNADGIQIAVSNLGSDNVGNYLFQIADVKGGFSEGFSKFSWIKNDQAALPRANHISGIGSGPFNPNKLSNWNYDERGVVIAPNVGTLRNIYAPQAVLSDGRWYVYYGGWDGVASGNDSIHVTTTQDFITFTPRAQAISNGSFEHVNNSSVIKVGPNDWRMFFTCYPVRIAPSVATNKTCVSTSNNGVSWTPNQGTLSQLVTIQGYPNWSEGDFNGGNAILKDANGLWHLYFQDFSPNPANVGGVLHATSQDGRTFSFVGQVLTPMKVPQEMKRFLFNNKPFYVGLFHLNTDRIWATVSEDLQSLGKERELFTNLGAEDRYMVAAGLVQDGSRIFGIIYGASPTSSLMQNKIFARWLQKKVIFQNSRVRWGDIERGFGPDALRLYQAASDSIETGNFYVYDTDGTTLLFVSPTVSIRPGDVWHFFGP